MVSTFLTRYTTSPYTVSKMEFSGYEYSRYKKRCRILILKVSGRFFRCEVKIPRLESSGYDSEVVNRHQDQCLEGQVPLNGWSQVKMTFVVTNHRL